MACSLQPSILLWCLLNCLAIVFLNFCHGSVSFWPSILCFHLCLCPVSLCVCLCLCESFCLVSLYYSHVSLPMCHVLLSAVSSKWCHYCVVLHVFFLMSSQLLCQVMPCVSLCLSVSRFIVTVSCFLFSVSSFASPVASCSFVSAAFLVCFHFPR